MFNLGYEMDLTSPVYHTSILLVYVNCTINPFVYLIKYDPYKAALKEVFRKLRCPQNRVNDIVNVSLPRSRSTQSTKY